VTTARRRSGAAETSARRGPGRPAIPLERIIATAVRIVDEQGAEALSMRSLAQALESGTATLYRHFANRAELVAHLVDRVFGETAIDADALAAMPWQQACHGIARAMFDALARHRNVAPLLTQQVTTGPNAMAIRERCLSILLGAGFDPRLAARSYATLSRYVLGFALQFAVQADVASTAEADDVSVLRNADPHRYPAIAAVADSLPVSLEEEFGFGLELLLRGLALQTNPARDAPG
jgi:TetR/AcrR family tetracycline transcriptional repressor